MPQTVVVRAVYDGDKAGSKVIFQGQADDGVKTCEFLDANVKLPDPTGYIVDKWYRWDSYGSKLAAGDTIRGWTNAYVTYTTDPNYSPEKLYIKMGGSWVACSKIYKKVNGVWTAYDKFSDFFEDGAAEKNWIPSWRQN